jgi:predicted DsbA family dithiol-disulfide isomerase
MHERLFTNQRNLTPKELPDHAQAIGIDVPKFRQCVDSGKYAARIRKDLGDGQKVGVTGTPGFFLGVTEPSGTEIKATRVIKGAQPYAAFKEAIDSLLGAK